MGHVGAQIHADEALEVVAGPVDPNAGPAQEVFGPDERPEHCRAGFSDGQARTEGRVLQVFTHPPGAVAFDFGPELGGEGVFGGFEGVGGFPFAEDDGAGSEAGGLGDVEDGGFGDSDGFD